MSVLALALLALQTVNPHAAALDSYRKHDYAGATTGFKQALETEKAGSAEYQESLLLLAQSYFLTSHAPEAIPYLEKASKSNEVLYMLGNAYLAAGNTGKASANFAAMYGFSPASAAAHLLTAQMMMRREDLPGAEAELKTAMSLDPKLPQSHYLLGEIHMFAGDAARAIADLKQEIALNPNWSMAYYKLGDAYSRQNDWPTAIEHLQKSIWLNPDFSGPYILLGKGYLKLDQAANAEGVLRHAVQVDPNNYSAHYLLGQALMQQGRTDEGKRVLEESQKLKH